MPKSFRCITATIDDVCKASLLNPTSNSNEFRKTKDILRTYLAKHAGARRETTLGKGERVHIYDHFIAKPDGIDHAYVKLLGKYLVNNVNACCHTDPVVVYGPDVASAEGRNTGREDRSGHTKEKAPDPSILHFDPDTKVSNEHVYLKGAKSTTYYEILLLATNHEKHTDRVH